MWSPDELDIQIIKAMASPSAFQWDPRITYAQVAKGLAVDEETVRKRLRHMNEVGFLQGWQLILNPILLGRMAAIVELHVGDPESKTEVIPRLSLLEGVTLIDDFYGSELAIHLLYENEEALTRQVQLIASLCGCPTPLWWRLGFPPCELTPTKTDWRIIQTLLPNARAKLSDVARDLQLSTRTVKRRMKRLVNGNAFYLDPLLDLEKIVGVRCRFWITCKTSEKQAVDTKVLSGLKRILSTHTAPQEYSLFVAHCVNAAEVQEISNWLGKLDGVKEVRANMEVEHIHVRGWLAEEIERRVLTPASRPSHSFRRKT
jgi:DNA-binding Lrp family transcriptional regulator